MPKSSGATPSSARAKRSSAAKGGGGKPTVSRAAKAKSKKNGAAANGFVPPPPLFPKPKRRPVPVGMTELAERAPARPAAFRPRISEPEPAPSLRGARIYVLNVNRPGRRYRCDAVKYGAVRAAILKHTPKRRPGLTRAELMATMRAKLPKAMFPGTTSSWWTKTVQLDLEARGALGRDDGKPLRWVRLV